MNIHILQCLPVDYISSLMLDYILMINHEVEAPKL